MFFELNKNVHKADDSLVYVKLRVSFAWLNGWYFSCLLVFALQP